MRYMTTAAAMVALICSVSVDAAKVRQTVVSSVQANDAAAEIIAQERAMEQAYNLPDFAKNPGMIHHFFAPDIVLIDAMEPGYFGGANALQHADELGVMFIGRVRFENMKVKADQRFGYVDYIQHLTGKTTTGQSYDLRLLSTDIWRKIDGTWKLVLQHVSLPMDMATFAKAMTPKPAKE